MTSLRYWLVLLVLGAAFFGWSIVRANRQEATHEPSANPAGSNLNPKPNWPPLEDFQLIDQTGKPFNSATLRGHVWVASFFFTNCPAICWRLNQAIAGLRETMGKSDVRFVSVTCDPTNDTAEKLAPYAKHFGAEPDRWTFLTGELADLQGVAKQFLVALDKGSHSSRVFVVDRGGKVRAMFSLTDPGEPERLKKLLAKLEAEPVPAVPDTGGAAGSREKESAFGATGVPPVPPENGETRVPAKDGETHEPSDAGKTPVSPDSK